MGKVVNLHTDSGPWAPYERAVLGAMQREFLALGIETDCEHGRAEDGTPWTAFYAISNGHSLLMSPAKAVITFLYGRITHRCKSATCNSS